MAKKVTNWVSKGAVRFTLVVIALFWLVPGLGLLVTSFRPFETFAQNGWWNAFTNPSELTIRNYTELLGDSDLIDSIVTTFIIAVPSTVLPVLFAAAARHIPVNPPISKPPTLERTSMPSEASGAFNFKAA